MCILFIQRLGVMLRPFSNNVPFILRKLCSVLNVHTSSCDLNQSIHLKIENSIFLVKWLLIGFKYDL
jgi:hypothetical protein